MGKKRNTKRYIAIGGVIVLFILMFGLAYAIFTVTLNGTKKVKVKSGTLDLRLVDNDDNYIDDLNPNADYGYEINLDNAIPEPNYDVEANENNQFIFKLKNEGTIAAKYSISLEDLELESGEERLDDSFVGFSLSYSKKINGITRNYIIDGVISDLENRVLDLGVIPINETYTYTLTLWLEDDAITSENQQDAMNKVFSAHLKVDGVQYTYDNALDVRFDSKKGIYDISSQGNAIYQTPTVEYDVDQKTTTLKGMNISLTTPGDSVSYKVNIENKGIYDVTIDEDPSSTASVFDSECHSKNPLPTGCSVFDFNNDGIINISDKTMLYNTVRINYYFLRGNPITLHAGESKTIEIFARYDINGQDYSRTFPIYNGDLVLKYSKL